MVKTILWKVDLKKTISVETFLNTVIQTFPILFFISKMDYIEVLWVFQPNTREQTNYTYWRQASGLIYHFETLRSESLPTLLINHPQDIHLMWIKSTLQSLTKIINKILLRVVQMHHKTNIQLGKIVDSLWFASFAKGAIKAKMFNSLQQTR